MKKILYTFLLISPLFFITSCEKEVEGCTNSEAINYNADATIDNLTCNFERKISFWLSAFASLDCVLNDISYLSVYVNGNLIGILNPDYYFDSEPACGYTTDALISTTLPISSEPSEVVAYQIRTPLGNLKYIGSNTIYGSDCESVQLD